MPSEFSALLDLVISRGYTHSQLISEIHDAVIAAYKKSNPRGPIGVEVWVDERTGEVRLMLGTKDATTEDFRQEAASTARMVLISKLTSDAPASAVVPASPAAPGPAPVVRLPGVPGRLKSYAANIFFFGYNLYFLLFVVLLLVAGGQDLAGSATTGSGIMRILFSVTALVIPMFCIAVAVKRKLYEVPGKLGQLFFLFELPVLFTLFLATTVVREYSPLAFVVVLSVLSIPFFLYAAASDLQVSERIRRGMLIAGQSVLFVLSYILFLVSFYVPVVLGNVAAWLFSDIFTSIATPAYDYMGPMYQPAPNVIEILMRFSLGFLALLLITGIVTVPFLLVYRLARYVIDLRRRLGDTWGYGRMMKVQAASAVALILVVAGLSVPGGDIRLLGQLGKVRQSDSFTDREAVAAQLVSHEAELKKLLRDSGSMGGRYPFSRDSRDLAYLYEHAFNVSPDVAEGIQKLFLAAAYPFVFPGDRSGGELSYGFQYVFGHSYYDDAPAKTTAAEQSVLLTSRTVGVAPGADGTSATVSVDEEYDNTTYRQQEVVYEFSLPAGSVVTGLKLGPDLEFPGVIAPRGAAQQTYQQEVNRSRDPALLEQIGPSSYRLRVFPVPAKGDMATLKGKRQRVMFTYVVPAGEKGFALPDYTKSQNVRITNATQMSLTRGSSTYPLSGTDAYIAFDKAGGGSWCSTRAPEDLTFSESVKARVTQAAADGKLKSIICAPADAAMGSITGKRIAVVLDVSAGGLGQDTVTGLKNVLVHGGQFLETNSVDLIRANDVMAPAVRLTKASAERELSRTVLFGTGSVLTALSGMPGTYDAVFVVTGTKSLSYDNGSYPFKRTSRVYFVHPDTWPSYHMALTNRIMQSGGGSAKSFADAVRMYAASIAVPDTAVIAGSMKIEYTGLSGFPAGRLGLPKPTTSSTTTLSAVGNAGLLTSAVRRYPGDLTGNITLMDDANAFAKSAGIVTDYSSAIALVNERQQQNLDRNSADYWRYQDQGSGFVQPPTPMVDMVMPQRSIMPSFGVSSIGSSSLNLPKAGGAEMSGAAGMGSADMTISQNTTLFKITDISGGPVILFVIGNGAVLVVGMMFFLVRSFRKPRTA